MKALIHWIEMTWTMVLYPVKVRDLLGCENKCTYTAPTKLNLEEG